MARLAELDEENALTRQQIIEHEAREIRIRARLCQLRRLADETWAMAEGIVGHEALIDRPICAPQPDATGELIGLRVTP